MEAGNPELLTKNILKLNQSDHLLLNEITKRGQINKAAQRLNMELKDLQEKLAIICDKLEIFDKDNTINLEKLVKWAKNNGF